MPLSEIVNVNITTATQQVSQAGFGTLMILGVHKNFNDRIRYYSSLSSVGEDFDASSPEYIAAQDVFSQVLTPELIAIGRRQANNATVDVLSAEDDKTYSTVINTSTFSINSTPSTQDSTVVLSADLVDSNSIAVSLNGTAITGSPFTYATSHIDTMNTIATALAATDGVASATVGGANNRTIYVVGDVNTNAIVTTFTITGGVSQATATIVSIDQTATTASIANALCTAINAGSEPVTATDNEDGTFTVAPNVSGTPFTISVETNIVNPKSALLEVTQVVPASLYYVNINSSSFEYTAPVTVQDNETIAAALVALINAGDEAVTAVDNADGSFTVTSTDDSTFTLSYSDSTISGTIGLNIEPLVTSETMATCLDAINDSSSDWYALSYIRRVKADVLEAAAWIEANTKIFGTSSDDANIIDLPMGSGSGHDTTSIAALVNAAGYTRTFVMYHQDAAHDYPECAWMGRVLPLTSGSETWAFKNLASISTSNLTENQSKNCLDKKANTYQFIGGVGITRNGTVGSGQYIDIIRGIDWLQARIQEYVYSLLVNSNKVPYTDTGAAMVQSEVYRALALGVTNNFLSDNPSPVVTVPKVSTISSNTKAQRLLPDVNFTATLAGAIQKVVISGRVSL